MQLLSIFVNVLVPVFALVVIGYTIGPRLELDPRTLSRYIFTLLTPAFVFDVLSSTTIAAPVIARMTGYIVVVHVGCAIVGFLVAKFLRRSTQMTAVYVLMAMFGNVGNFGLPIIQFALGNEALAAAAVYFLVITIVAFTVGVAAANWNRGSRLHALLAVVRTPALIVVIPAMLCNWFQIDVPLVLMRPISLLSGALIPTMLVMLGVQLAAAGIPRLSLDMVATSVIRLVVSPVLAVVLAGPCGITGIERSTGIVQSSMPIAVLTSIIAMENDLLPNFVTATILFSTLASVITLTLVIAFV